MSEAARDLHLWRDEIAAEAAAVEAELAAAREVLPVAQARAAAAKAHLEEINSALAPALKGRELAGALVLRLGTLRDEARDAIGAAERLKASIAAHVETLASLDLALATIDAALRPAPVPAVMTPVAVDEPLPEDDEPPAKYRRVRR